MPSLSYIIWNFDPTLVTFDLSWMGLGETPIRWYGLFFALGFLLSQQVLFYVYKQEMGPSIKGKNNAEKLVESMTIYMIIATIVGARLGHVLFYQPMDYLTDPIRILNIREGGLASHGAAVGIFFSIWLFSKYRFNFKKGNKYGLFFIKNNRGYTYLQILDRLAFVVALTGALIRFGNFTNSEIIGKPTHTDSGVVFARDVTDYINYEGNGTGWVESFVIREDPEGDRRGTQYEPVKMYLEFKDLGQSEADLISYLDNGVNTKLGRLPEHVDEPVMHNLNYELIVDKAGNHVAVISSLMIPRHPAQLYESISYLLLFFLFFFLWSRQKINLPEGRLFSLFLIFIFGFRFIFEFLKENQVAFEDNMQLNMGQWLSIPLIVTGIILLVRSFKDPQMPSQGTGS